MSYKRTFVRKRNTRCPYPPYKYVHPQTLWFNLRPCSYFRCGWTHSGGHFSKKIWKMISMARTTLSQHAVTWPEKAQSMPPEMQLTGQNQRRLVPKVRDFKSPTYCQHRSRPRLVQGRHSTRVRTEQRPWKEGRGGLQRLQRWISWQAPWCWWLWSGLGHSAVDVVLVFIPLFVASIYLLIWRWSKLAPLIGSGYLKLMTRNMLTHAN